MVAVSSAATEHCVQGSKREDRREWSEKERERERERERTRCKCRNNRVSHLGLGDDALYILLYVRSERHDLQWSHLFVHISGNQQITLAPSVRSTSGVAKWIPEEASMTVNCRRGVSLSHLQQAKRKQARDKRDQ
jgi:hypothetical protein